MNKPIFIALVAFAARSAYAETLLFLDDHEVLYRSGTKRFVHSFEKFKGNPVITPDNPERPREKSIQWVIVYRDPKSGKMQLWLRKIPKP